MKELIGQWIEAIIIDDNNECLQFITKDGETITYKVYGDCCSHSWFNDILGVDNLLPSLILDVQEISLEEIGLDFSQEIAEKVCHISDPPWQLTQIYGYKIITTRGICDIIFRNESNGYYGGWCRITSSKLETGKLITEDWSRD
jgi:hypothetical protein